MAIDIAVGLWYIGDIVRMRRSMTGISPRFRSSHKNQLSGLL